MSLKPVLTPRVQRSLLPVRIQLPGRCPALFCLLRSTCRVNLVSGWVRPVRDTWLLLPSPKLLGPSASPAAPPLPILLRLWAPLPRQLCPGTPSSSSQLRPRPSCSSWLAPDNLAPPTSPPLGPPTCPALHPASGLLL